MVGVLVGILLSPYLIRKLGDEGYGIWVLVFTLAEYYWFLDFGLRSATVKYTAHYYATGEHDRINELISTAVVYFSGVAVAVVLITVGLSHQIASWFQVSAANQRAFLQLIIIVGINWAAGAVGGVFLACLDGLQRFDISSQIKVAVILVRTAGVVILLATGYGLTAIGLMVLSSQLLGYLASYAGVRAALPRWRFSLRLASFSTLKQMASFGIHTFTAGIAQQVLDQGPPVLVGHYRPASYVGYYSIPVRMMAYATDLIDRIALVTTPVASELTAGGDRDSVSRLAVYTSRYSLALFLPVSITLWNYGYEVLRLWVGAEFAARSAPLVPVLAVATIMVPGQFNCAAVLYGMAKHRGYARALLAEAAVNLALQLIVIPKYGILGAVWVSACLLIINRGLLTPWFLARAVGLRWTQYLAAVYARPLASALPVFAFAWLLKRSLLSGANLPQLVCAVALIGAAYLAIAFRVCIRADHRSLIWRGLGRYWRAAAGLTGNR